MGLLFPNAAPATTTFGATATAGDATRDAAKEAAPPPATPSQTRVGKVRQKKAHDYGARIAILDKTAEKARTRIISTDPSHWTINPSAKAVNGAELLDAIAAVFERYLVLPTDASETLALWVAHTYVIDAGDISPILAVTSRTKRCGKTTLFKILAWLARKTVFVSNISAAAIYRYVHAKQPTLLIDEGDTFLPGNREMRNILNAGNSRGGAYVIRTDGCFFTWGAKAIALIGTLHDTLEDRSIMVPMQRKKSSEQRPRYRDGDCPQFRSLRSLMLRWTRDNFRALAASDPEIPGVLNDRAADNWRPLIAIADLAGGRWPEAARKSAVALSGTTENDSADIGLLHDVRWIFDGKPVERDGETQREYPPTDKLFSQTIVDELNKIETSPWAGWRHGKGFTPCDLAKMLKGYGAAPETVRIGSETAKGYYRNKLTDAFERYLPPDVSVTTSQTNETGHNSRRSAVTRAVDVTDEIQQISPPIGHCDAVTLQEREDR
jgi:putative DNA primase/helicase